jgi:hypothetical protein
MNTMKLHKILILALTLLSMGSLTAQKVDEPLRKTLEPIYEAWRTAMVQKNHPGWRQLTAKHRQITIYNRILSSRLPYPGAVFNLPFAPPPLAGLRPLNVNMEKNTAIATYFGKVDFGIEGKPTENLMVLYFVGEEGLWKYDTADFINLSALPEIRDQIKRGDLSYVAQKDFKASGVSPEMPKLLNKFGYIAKAYVFCPGREVKLNINDISKHRFQNDKSAEIVIGGAFDGNNTISFTSKVLPDASGKDPIDIRIFLMSQITGVQPVNVYQYRITFEEAKAGKKPAENVSTSFKVMPDHVKAILTKP